MYGRVLYCSVLQVEGKRRRGERGDGKRETERGRAREEEYECVREGGSMFM